MGVSWGLNLELSPWAHLGRTSLTCLLFAGPMAVDLPPPHRGLMREFTRTKLALNEHVLCLSLPTCTLWRGDSTH